MTTQPKTKAAELSEQVSEFLAEHDIDDAQLAALVEISVSILREKRISPEQIEIEILEDEDSRWLGYSLEVKLPVDEIVELDYEASMKEAAADIPPHVSDNVIVTITSVSE